MVTILVILYSAVTVVYLLLRSHSSKELNLKKKTVNKKWNKALETFLTGRFLFICVDFISFRFYFVSNKRVSVVKVILLPCIHSAAWPRMHIKHTRTAPYCWPRHTTYMYIVNNRCRSKKITLFCIFFFVFYNCHRTMYYSVWFVYVRCAII